MPSDSRGVPFHIGELAARTGRTVHAIRWYETQGLVPGVARDEGGRRLYGEPHVGWLDLMERLRRTGMSIAEMREYTALAVQGKTTLRQRRDMLAAHRERVTETIAEWKRALTLVERKIGFYDEWMASGHRPPPVPAGPATAAAAKPRGRRRGGGAGAAATPR
ncbi:MULTISPECIES: MerR family transcriptional regulator [Variovorax]|jgi:DNA-binding transcriptional MerR regulator|uniref:MerR family transcriptional regulator n=1 Tax=Variovorax TaxID=34072 RepID=UPI00086AE2E8|nr:MULTISPECIES: MerR family transcriptional regulator [Variovorax]MBN8758344.1 MerR family transcriptional regulator [Variovorax sp.]ODU13179.1 MAG: MerR family transcriptional regulator [Variovorax sp. SCN 67-85]ODV16516.1 MAG: MerR family transcriptional regulator [Variovorax sp. SCN 67-20]OJZ07378.1 MAG: MerR family transcriptional regulator [Variovorax sp. 67-131]UKI10722.1 MerR family transcriptional regulator [Variovorax paradoxus]